MGSWIRMSWRKKQEAVQLELALDRFFDKHSKKYARISFFFLIVIFLIGYHYQ